ncbi:trigger factor [Anaerosphaera aminiphila DSM 21120]|uniref:Trigger factor n=1 Tax=Anaerosphaera aminiphila DSM 21120 TaxID=1120995 RepID=A0A1M5TK13_9FIRM|nr:trigger factor [Anaerosphaera aminiphila]SHH51018.1 trigger factor [Anaerosphaera aminiphila DSM 21120]
MTEIKKKENNKVYFDMVVKAEDVESAEKEIYLKNKKYFQVPGFRKGHAPRKIIENMYGKEVFLEDALNEVLPKYYEKAVEELGIEPVEQPEINIEEAHSGKDVEVEFSVDVKPEVKLSEYKGVEVQEIAYEVTDELIDSELENQRKMNARIVNVDDRAAKSGDKVNIDFKGFLDGEEFDGGAAEGHELELGSNSFIPGFEDQIVGHNLDEEFDVNVTFPEDYHAEDLKGKDVVFKVKLNSISYEELPELDDEFIKDISDFDTVDEYRADVKAKKETEFEARAKSEKEEAILNKIVETMEVEVPNGMVNSQINSQMQNFDSSLRAQGMNLEDYVKMLGTTIEAFGENLREDAVKQVKMSLALEAIAKEENFEISEEDVIAEVEKLVKEYFPEDAEQQEKMKEYMLESSKDGIKENLANRKVLDLLVENAKFVEKQVEEEVEEK